MEMDAASRTGVDDIRELIDGVRYPLSSVQRVEYTPPVYPQPAADLPPAA